MSLFWENYKIIVCMYKVLSDDQCIYHLTHIHYTELLLIFLRHETRRGDQLPLISGKAAVLGAVLGSVRGI